MTVHSMLFGLCLYTACLIMLIIGCYLCALSTCLEQFRISLPIPDLNIQLSDHLTLLLFALVTRLKTYTTLAFILPASWLPSLVIQGIHQLQTQPTSTIQKIQSA